MFVLTKSWFKEITVQRFHKFIRVLLLTMLMVISITACGKKKDDDKDQTTSAVSGDTTEAQTVPVASTSSSAGEETGAATVPAPTVEIVSFDSSFIQHEKMQITLAVPQDALFKDSDNEWFAETSEYLLYIFGMDDYNDGIVYDEKEIITAINAKDKAVIAKDMLRLEDFSIPSDTQVELFNNVNGTTGFFCPMTKISFEDRDGGKCSGDGFTMVYAKKGGVGVYVVIGIVKDGADNTAERKTELKSILRSCAFSLQQSEDAKEEYVVWKETMPDEVDVKAVYKPGVVTEVVTEEKGFCLYYDEAKEGNYLIQHFELLGDASSEKYVQSIIDRLSENDAVSFTDIEEVRGKMVYKTTTMSYENNGQKMQEIICVSVDEKGSTWLVDLYGTAAEVEAQKENLEILLWSLQED